MATSGLLALPAELRIQIFTTALENVHCKYPVLIWDHVSIGSTAGKPWSGVGILLACRTTYEDCLPIIYSSTVLHMSVRGDTKGQGPTRGLSLRSILDYQFLERLQHIQLEISYKGSDAESINRVVRRLKKLSEAFKRAGNLKTVDLVFFDDGSRWVYDRDGTSTCRADGIVNVARDIEGQELVRVSRNEPAMWNMCPKVWEALRVKAGYEEDAREEFREITFDYWEHAFRLKN